MHPPPPPPGRPAPPPPPPEADDTWQIPTGTVRVRLLRRIASGEICGVISRVTGRPCLASPVHKGKPCQKHACGTQHEIPGVGAQTKAGRMIRAIYHDALSAEESRIFDQVFNDSPTLENEITLARVKLAKLERDYAAGKLKDRDYQKRWGTQMDALRKLVATNQKARLAEETLKALQDDPSTGPDKYDPLADDPEDDTGDASEDSDE